MELSLGQGRAWNQGHLFFYLAALGRYLSEEMTEVLFFEEASIIQR